jgi:glutamine amidotransferase
VRVKVALLDYGMGNLHSVSKALEAAGADVVTTPERGRIEACDALCIPGQGILDRCMSNITGLGLLDLVESWIADDRPYLGICLGMQLLYVESEEAGGTRGLGILAGKVTRLPSTVTVPHIGWNTVGDEYYYFDHSYAAHPADEATVTGWCSHGERFAARIDTGSVTAVQFHPEKSGSAGIELLRKWVGSV